MYRVLLFIVLLTGCQVNESSQELPQVKIDPISKLRELSLISSSCAVVDYIVIEGRVVANDKYGEFDNKIIIEDSSGAVEVMIDSDGGNYRLFEYGAWVRVYCIGLWVGNRGAELSIGTKPTSTYAVDCIDASDIGQYVRVIDNLAAMPLPTQITIGELTPLEISRLVKIEPIAFVGGGPVNKFCQRDSLTNRTINTSHMLVDPDGETIELFVNAECEYSDVELPAGEGMIYAIVNYFDGDYSLTITDYRIKF